VVHGLSIPLGKLGFFLPRTLSRVFTQNSDEPQSTFSFGQLSFNTSTGVLRERRKKNSPERQSTPGQVSSHGRVAGVEGRETRDEEPMPIEPGTPPLVSQSRTIRFPDQDELRLDGGRSDTRGR